MSLRPERQSRVEQLVKEALELSDQQRGEFLERHCGGDESLRAEVESLLNFEQDAEKFMDGSALQVAAQALAESNCATGDDRALGRQFGDGAVAGVYTSAEPSLELGLAGRRIGAYTLLAHIGSGGMGTVWLAERSDGRFERRTAVKFLSLALGGAGRRRTI